MHANHTRRRFRRAFTLIEILVVVVILGVLAAIVGVSVADSGEESRRTAFVTNLKSFAQTAEYLRASTGQWPPDGSSGALAPELMPFIDEGDFENGTDIGGVWDTEFQDNGVTAAVGVHFDGTGMTRDDAYMAEVDALMDDGDLSAGIFQKLASGRYYYILAP